MNLEIILKTCDAEYVPLKENTRYCGTDKKTVVVKCLTSIIHATQFCEEKIKLTVIDDNSSEECLSEVQKLLEIYPHEAKLYTREERSHNESMLQMFELARDSDHALVYCVQDDYLHLSYALSEMKYFYDVAFKNLHGSKDIVLTPHDDQNNYTVRNSEPAYIVQGRIRHWRTNSHASGIFMTTPSVINRNWKHLKTFAENDIINPSESVKMNNMWLSENVRLFTPVPSLVFHMKGEEERDKIINWLSVWNNLPYIA